MKITVSNYIELEFFCVRKGRETRRTQVVFEVRGNGGKVGEGKVVRVRAVDDAPLAHEIVQLDVLFLVFAVRVGVPARECRGVDGGERERLVKEFRTSKFQAHGRVTRLTRSCA